MTGRRSYVTLGMADKAALEGGMEPHQHGQLRWRGSSIPNAQPYTFNLTGLILFLFTLAT